MQKHSDLTYTSSFSVTDVLCSINTILEEDLLKSLNEAKFYALLADESSDESRREQFAILARFRRNGKVGDHYLGLIEVQRTDAESMMKEIEGFLIAKGVKIENAMFVGFDGCNTMSGQNKDLQRRFRHIVPHQIYINCRNHKLALCVKHLIKTYPVIDKVDSVLIGVWKMFHYSPKKFALFKQIQETYGLTKLTLIRAAATRWLSHGRACIRLVNRYVQIIDTLDAVLDQKYEPEVYGVREQLLEKNFMAAVLVLCDLLKPVVRFSDFLQGNNDFSMVNTKTKTLIEELHHLIERFRSNLQTPDHDLYLSKLPSIFEEIEDRNNLARRMRVQAVYTPEQVVEVLAVPITYALINEIQDAFHCPPVLSSFAVFDMQYVPNTLQELQNYGKESINCLADHYGRSKVDIFSGHRQETLAIFQHDEMKAEFNAFKHQMYLLKQRQCHGENQRLPSSQVVVQLFQQDNLLANAYPSIEGLVHLGAIIPSSTASVERIFSLMNSLCTPKRNRIGQASLDAVMRICLEEEVISPERLTRIINHFKNTRNRNIQL